MKQRIQKIKQHLKDNRRVYLACGGTAVVAAVGTLLVVRRDEMPDALLISKFNYKPRSEVTHATINLIERSTPSRPVHLKGTNLYFNSLNEAARETGHSLTMISKHVNGKIPDLRGDVFELLEPAS